MQLVGIIPESGEVLTHYHHMFDTTDTSCCQIKMGMVAYLGADHHIFNKSPANEKFAHICVAGHVARQGIHVKKWPQCQVSDGSAPFVVLAATLFVYTRHRESPTDVLRLLSLVQMRLLCRERAMCERKVKKVAPASVVSRAACVSRAPPADASRPALAC